MIPLAINAEGRKRRRFAGGGPDDFSYGSTYEYTSVAASFRDVEQYVGT